MKIFVLVIVGLVGVFMLASLGLGVSACFPTSKEREYWIKCEKAIDDYKLEKERLVRKGIEPLELGVDERVWAKLGLEQMQRRRVIRWVCFPVAVASGFAGTFLFLLTRVKIPVVLQSIENHKED